MSIQKTNTALTTNSNSNSSFDNSMLFTTKEENKVTTQNNTVPATKLQAAEALMKMHSFIGQSQLSAIGELCKGEEKQFFYDTAVRMANIIENMPVTYQTDGEGFEAVVYLHYFTATADFYISEKDREAEQLQAYGKADLFGDGGEVGYISIVEILRFGAELDLHWIPKKFSFF